MLKRLALIGLPTGGLLLLLPVAALFAQNPQTTAAGPPTAAAQEDVPAGMLARYQQAADTHCPELGWAVLAAVGKVESDHANDGALQPDGTTVEPIIGPRLDGTGGMRRIVDTDDGRLDGNRQFDRAVGPMQFIPTTSTRVGIDADEDGIANPHDVDDAIPATARQLCAAGADDPTRLRQALWSYNHSWDYVDQILNLANRYAAPMPGQADPELIQAVLDNPRLTIYAAGRDDIAAGRIDPRLLTPSCNRPHNAGPSASRASRPATPAASAAATTPAATSPTTGTAAASTSTASTANSSPTPTRLPTRSPSGSPASIRRYNRTRSAPPGLI